MKQFKLLLTVGAVALALPLVAQQNQFAETYAMKGKPLPKVSLNNINGKTWTNADLKGKVVLLDVFATWCGPCKAAAPKLQAMHNELASKGVMVIGANAGERGASGPLDKAAYMTKTKEYVAEHKYTYAFTTAADDVAKAMNVKAFPSFFIIDRKGVIREVFVGFNEAAIRKTLVALAAEK